MTKTQAAHKKSQKKSLREEKTIPSKWRSRTLLSGFVSLVSFLLGLIIFWPRPSVSTVQENVAGDPLSAAFTITNAGFISLHHTSARLAIGKIVGEPTAFQPLKSYPKKLGKIERPEWLDHTLTRDEQFTISTGHLFIFKDDAKLSGGDLAIAVTYQPWVIPITMEKWFRFVTHKLPDGRFEWYSMPLDQKPE